MRNSATSAHKPSQRHVTGQCHGMLRCFLITRSLSKVKVSEGLADLGPKYNSQQLRDCDPRPARAAPLPSLPVALEPLRAAPVTWAAPAAPGPPWRHRSLPGSAPWPRAAPRAAHARRSQGPAAAPPPVPGAAHEGRPPSPRALFQ